MSDKIKNKPPKEILIVQTDIPEADHKQPTFRVPYDLMSMQSQYKDEFIDNIMLGIDLTVAEDHHVHTMSKLLHIKSEHKDQSSSAFYLGNINQNENTTASFQLINNKQIITQNMPVYKVSQQEYYETYLNRKAGGSDIADINQTLDSLAKKSFALRVSVPVGKDKKGNKLYDYYEGIDYLFKVVKVVRGITETDINKVDNGDAKLSQEKGEFIFTLHPIFRHHIEDRYGTLPLDIYERIKKVAKSISARITPGTNALRNYLFMQLRNMRMREKKQASKDYSFHLNNDNLYALLKIDHYIKNGRIGDANKAKNKTIQIFTTLGLILHVEEVIGAEGQLMHAFTLNKDFS